MTRSTFAAIFTRRINEALVRLQCLGHDTRAQDMVEYALLAGFIAVSAASLFPGIAHNLMHIFEHLEEAVEEAAEA